MINFTTNKLRLISLVIFLNLIFILIAYQSVFKLELEGDSWFYGWASKVYYESNVFSRESFKALRTSLGGATLTYELIQNNFGLSGLAFYSISVILKLFTTITFYFLVNKLTKNFVISLVASLLLAVTFAGVEATHWVFNMYAYIGLIFIMISLMVGLDLPKSFTFKKWLVSFLFACLGVWYATMRTNGIIPLMIFWSFYKFISLRSKSSKLNLIFWVIGFAIFIILDKFLLGQMESSYSQTYIIEEGIRAIQSQLIVHKYDFLFAPATNLGAIILPDNTWSAFNFPGLFSFLGSSVLKTVFLPSFIFFVLVTTILVSAINKTKKAHTFLTPKFIVLFTIGFIWTVVIFLITKLGPLNFSSWTSLVMTLFGGYMMLVCLFLFFLEQTSPDLKDLLFLSFFWFFLFLLLPLFQNGGGFFGTYHRYMATTAPSVPLFVAGLLSLSIKYKSTLFRMLLFSIILLIFFTHIINTKAFFDRKAVAHNRDVSQRIWRQLGNIIPKKPQYHIQPPAIFFAAANNPIDEETLFESLAYSYDFRADLEFGWPHNQENFLYNKGNYEVLLSDVKKNPKQLEDFYAVMVQDQNLYDITLQLKERLALDMQETHKDESAK